MSEWLIEVAVGTFIGWWLADRAHNFLMRRWNRRKLAPQDRDAR